ncbi:glutamate receptor ionotropic, delta-2-like [Littorina saxatilis]|uniref:glutamate receptor ionotropic, delta-2-like n=1 Tax=Littorina saxatilis TaxID=31220 RepID=UPI0038B46503
MAPRTTSGEKGQSVRVGYNPLTPYIMDSHESGQNKYSGFCVDLLDILAESLNFTFSFVKPPDGEWGDKRDGNWTGLVRLLEKKEADICLTLAPSAERSEVVDWTVPFDNWHNGVAVRTRPDATAAGMAFIAPFHWMVYVCIGVTFFLATLVLLCLLRAEQFLSSDVDTRSPSTPTTIVQSIEFMFGSLVNEGENVK